MSTPPILADTAPFVPQYKTFLQVVLNIRFIPIGDQLVDGFTKPLTMRLVDGFTKPLTMRRLDEFKYNLNLDKVGSD
jgi:hypothetical protein